MTIPRRYIQFKKNKEFIIPFKTKTGVESGQYFPLDSPISFAIESNYTTPVPDLMKHIDNMMVENPLSFITYIPSIVNDFSKLSGVAWQPRGYYAKAWQETTPLVFTIPIDLKFGWLGRYSGKEEIHDIVEYLMDASLPYMQNTAVDFMEAGKKMNFICSPAPNGFDVLMEAGKEMLAELSGIVGAITGWAGDLFTKNEKNIEGLGNQYQADRLDSEYLLGLQFDISAGATKGRYYVRSIRVRNKNGDDQTYWNVSNARNPEEINKLFKIYDEEAKAFTESIKNKSIPECYVYENMEASSYRLGQVESWDTMVDATARSFVFNSATNASPALVFVPVSKSKEGGKPSTLKNSIKEDKDNLSQLNNTWEVIINGKLHLKNLVLDSFVYDYNNEHDSQGYSTSAKLNLTFATQRIPVTSSDFKKFYDMIIV